MCMIFDFQACLLIQFCTSVLCHRSSKLCRHLSVNCFFAALFYSFTNDFLLVFNFSQSAFLCSQTSTRSGHYCCAFSCYLFHHGILWLCVTSTPPHPVAALSNIHLLSTFPPTPCGGSASLFSARFSTHPTYSSLSPCHLSSFQYFYPVLWWGAGWPWISPIRRKQQTFPPPPLHPFLPQSAGKEGARRMGSTSRVFNFLEERENERVRGTKWAQPKNIKVFRHSINVYFHIHCLKYTIVIPLFHVPPEFSHLSVPFFEWGFNVLSLLCNMSMFVWPSGGTGVS